MVDITLHNKFMVSTSYGLSWDLASDGLDNPWNSACYIAPATNVWSTSGFEAHVTRNAYPSILETWKKVLPWVMTTQRNSCRMNKTDDEIPGLWASDGLTIGRWSGWKSQDFSCIGVDIEIIEPKVFDPTRFIRTQLENPWWNLSPFRNCLKRGVPDGYIPRIHRRQRYAIARVVVFRDVSGMSVGIRTACWITLQGVTVT